MNPSRPTSVVGYEVFTLNYDLLVGFGPDLEPAPGFADRGNVRGRHDLDVQDPRRHEVVRRRAGDRRGRRWLSSSSSTPSPREVTLGSGYLDPYLTYAGVTAVRRRTQRRSSSRPRRRTPLILTAYVPILPKHIWESTREQSATPKPTTSSPTIRRSSAPAPYQAVEWKTGEFMRFVRNPNYWGAQGAADEVDHPALRDATTRWSRRSSTASIDYARGIDADQFDALEGQPDIVTVDGRRGERLPELDFNGYEQGHPRWRRVDHGARGPGLPRRPRLRHRQAGARRPRPGGYGTPARRHSRRSRRSGTWHVEPQTPADLRHRSSPSRSSTAAGYSSRTRPASGSTRKASRSPPDGRAGLRRASRRRPVHHRLVG